MESGSKEFPRLLPFRATSHQESFSQPSLYEGIIVRLVDQFLAPQNDSGILWIGNDDEGIRAQQQSVTRTILMSAVQQKGKYTLKENVFQNYRLHKSSS